MVSLLFYYVCGWGWGALFLSKGIRAGTAKWRWHSHVCLLCRMLRVTIAGASPAMVTYFSSDIRLPPFHLVGAGGGCKSRCESAKEWASCYRTSRPISRKSICCTLYNPCDPAHRDQYAISALWLDFPVEMECSNCKSAITILLSYRRCNELHLHFKMFYGHLKEMKFILITKPRNKCPKLPDSGLLTIISCTRIPVRHLCLHRLNHNVAISRESSYVHAHQR